MNCRRLMGCSAWLLVCILILTGCKEEHEHSDHDGHDHGPKTPQKTPATADHDHDDHEGHDHGHDHDHGDHEGHDHGAECGDEHPTDHVDEVTLTPEAVERWKIRVERVSKQVLSHTFSVPSRVSFNLDAVAHVGSVVSGRIREVKVRVGDAVHAGDVLLVVTSPELGQAQSDYLQKRTAIVTAEASVKVARTLHENAKALYEESQGIALSEVHRREAEWRAAEGQLVVAKGAASAAESLLHLLGMDQAAVETLVKTGEINPQFNVRAPIGGRVIERAATLGESVGPDRDALLVIADMKTLWVVADVPESRIGQVKVGTEAGITVHALSDMRLTGVVGHIASRLDTSTRTAAVRIDVHDPPDELRPGMFAEAQIAVGGASDPVLAVSAEALQNVEGQTSVFIAVEGEPNTFAKRAVRVGQQVGRWLPVLEGLREGDHYVTSGSFILKADLGKSGAAHEH